MLIIGPACLRFILLSWFAASHLVGAVRPPTSNGSDAEERPAAKEAVKLGWLQRDLSSSIRPRPRPKSTSLLLSPASRGDQPSLHRSWAKPRSKSGSGLKESDDLVSSAFTLGAFSSGMASGHRREEKPALPQSQHNHPPVWLHINEQTQMHGGGQWWLEMNHNTQMPTASPTILPMTLPTTWPAALIFSLLLCLWVFLTLARKSETSSPRYTPDELWRRELEKRMREATPVSADKCRSILDHLFGLDSQVVPAKTRRLQLRRRLTEQRMYQDIELVPSREA